MLFRSKTASPAAWIDLPLRTPVQCPIGALKLDLNNPRLSAPIGHCTGVRRGKSIQAAVLAALTVAATCWFTLAIESSSCAKPAAPREVRAGHPSWGRLFRYFACVCVAWPGHAAGLSTQGCKRPLEHALRPRLAPGCHQRTGQAFSEILDRRPVCISCPSPGTSLSGLSPPKSL